MIYVLIILQRRLNHHRLLLEEGMRTCIWQSGFCFLYSTVYLTQIHTNYLAFIKHVLKVQNITHSYQKLLVRKSSNQSFITMHPNYC